jgi:hypothetical protein
MNDIIDCRLVSGIVAHVVVNTPMELYSIARFNDIIVVWDESLECHGAIKQAHDPAPTLSFDEVTFLDNLNNLIVSFHTRPKHKESTLHRFIFTSWWNHVIISSKDGVYTFRQGLILPHDGRHISGSFA